MHKKDNLFSISGVGMYVPDKILTNEEIESWSIGTTAEWIRNNIGVIERRIADKNDKCYDYAIYAAQSALKTANLRPDDIDLIITASVTADKLLPHPAAFVRHGLNAKKAVCFDVLASCAGFVYGIITALGMAANDSSIRNVLMVASDMLSRITDWTDRKLCCAYGDGAGAFVITRSNEAKGIQAISLLHDDEGLKYNEMPAYYGLVPDRTSIHYKYIGRQVLELLKGNIPKVMNDLLLKTGWSKNELDMVMLPQTNKNMIEDILKETGIPLDKTHMVMQKYGYTASSCLPITVYDAFQYKKLKKGDKVIIVGAGLGCYFAGIALTWAI